MQAKRSRRRMALSLVAVLLLSMVGAGFWGYRRFNAKPPPVAAGQIRVHGPPGGGIPPAKVKFRNDIFVNAVFGKDDNGRAVANMGFYAGATQLAVVEAGEGDVFSVRDMQVRVAHFWRVPKLKNKAVDLEILSGGD